MALPNNKLLKRLSTIVATLGAGQVILLTQVPIISARCQLSILEIGSLVALGTFCFMFAGTWWGARSDRWGRRVVVIVGLGGAATAQLLFVLVLVAMAYDQLGHITGLVLLALSRLAYGLTASSVYPACQAWAVESLPHDRRLSALSTLSAATNAGRVLGPLLALPTLAIGGLWPLLWLFVLPIIGAGLLPSKDSQTKPVAVPANHQHTGLQVGLSSLLLIAMLATAAIGQLQVMLGPVMTDYYAMSALVASSATAWLLLGVAIVGLLTQLLLVRRLRSSHFSLALGAVFLNAGAGLLWLSLGSVYALVGLVVFVIGVACTIPSYTALLSEQAGSDRQGRSFGLLSMMHTGGYTLGFIIGGGFYSLGQPLLGLVIMVGFLAVVTALVLLRKAPPTVSVGAAVSPISVAVGTQSEQLKSTASSAHN